MMVSQQWRMAYLDLARTFLRLRFSRRTRFFLHFALLEG